MRSNFASAFLVLSALTAVGCSDSSSDGTASTSPGASGSGGASSGSGGTSSALGGAAGVGGSKAGAAGNVATAGQAGAGGSVANGGSTTAAGAGGSAGQAGNQNGGSAGNSTSAALVAPCTDYWTKVCTEEQMCLPATFSASYADLPTCISQNAANCATSSLGPSSTATSDGVAACLGALGMLDCGSLIRLLNDNITKPAACTLPPGTLPAKAPCLSSSECASNYCRVGFNGGCGTCQPLATGTTMCRSDFQCAAGQTCAGGACLPYADLGQSCAATNCYSDLACIANVCAPLPKDGTICDPNENSCGADSTCNLLTLTCSPLATATLGQPCAYTSSGDYAQCTGGSLCDVVQDLGSGTCVAGVADGGACKSSSECGTYSVCAAGICTALTPTYCEGLAGAGGAGGQGGSGGSSGSAGAAGTGGSGGALDPGAPSTVYPAPHPALPVALKGPAPVMDAPVIVPIVFPGDSLVPKIETFITNIVSSTYFHTTTSEYGVGAPTSLPPITLTDVIPSTISDQDIQTLLIGKLMSGDPAYGNHDINHIYAFFFSDLVTITDGGGQMSCAPFLGYHSSVILPDGTETAYAVIPACGGGISSVSGPASHEFVESMTDPRAGTEFLAYSGVDQDHLAWGAFGGAELGDLCETNITSNFNVEDDVGSVVQSTWSNVSAAAGHSPCVPWSGVYFGAAPVLNDDITLGSFNAGVTKGVKIPLGGSGVVELDLFSDGPTSGPISVSGHDGTSLSAGGAALLSFSFDRVSGLNGEKIYMTITVDGLPTRGAGETFYVEAKVGSVTTQWWGAVGQ